MGYHLIGEPFEEQPAIFELRLDDHILDIKPESFKLTDEDTPSINPHDYFITSGDAVLKATKLEQDLWTLAGKAQSYGGKKPTKKYQSYTKAIWKAAGQARSLLAKLKEARGDSCFLETEWRNHALLCIPKNPRKR